MNMNRILNYLRNHISDMMNNFYYYQLEQFHLCDCGYIECDGKMCYPKFYVMKKKYKHYV